MSDRPPQLSTARISGFVALAVTLLAAVLSAPANAQLLSASTTTEPATPDLIDRAEDRGAIDLETANLYRVYALRGDARLPETYESKAPWRGTLLLLELRENFPKMEAGPKRRAVAEALRVPEDPNPSVCSDSASALPNHLETEHFYIQYNQASLHPSLTIQAYADSLEEAYAAEVASFRWAAPPATALGQSALGGKYHVRVDSLDSNLYGFVSSAGTYAGNVGNNPNTSWGEGDAFASCMALNQNFNPFPGTAQQALDATTAHEFNHSLQFGYGTLIGSNVPDDNFVEGGATWMEDEAQDATNDNYNYLYPAFTESMGEHPFSSGEQYSYWLTFRGITERFGANVPGGAEQVMQEFWERVSRNDAVMLDAFNGALVGIKGRTLADTYHDYAIAAKLMRTCGGVYFLPYCFEEAAGYVAETGAPPASQGTIPAFPGSYNGSIQDNYTINWVNLPATGSYDVTLSTTGGQLRATVACDTASGVAIAPFPATVTSGPPGTIQGFDSNSCPGTPVAVITNQLQTGSNPGTSTARSYTLSTATGTGGPTTAVVPERPVEQPPDNGSPAPVATNASSSGPTVVDVIDPVLSSISLSSRRFRAARAGAAIAAAPLGTRVRYRLSEAATVSVRYERRVTGRRVGGRCRAVTRRNGGRARCSRFVLVRGTARHRGKAGANSFRLRGRMNGRPLRPGVYRLRLSARDPARNTSRTRRSASFRIVRR